MKINRTGTTFRFNFYPFVVSQKNMQTFSKPIYQTKNDFFYHKRNYLTSLEVNSSRRYNLRAEFLLYTNF